MVSKRWWADNYLSEIHQRYLDGEIKHWQYLDLVKDHHIKTLPKPCACYACKR